MIDVLRSGCSLSPEFSSIGLHHKRDALPTQSIEFGQDFENSTRWHGVFLGDRIWLATCLVHGTRSIVLPWATSPLPYVATLEFGGHAESAVVLATEIARGSGYCQPCDAVGGHGDDPAGSRELSHRPRRPN